MESMPVSVVLTECEQHEITKTIARLEALLSAEPRFLPNALSFIEYINRTLAREERAKVCDTTTFPVSADKFLIKAGH